MLLNVQEEKQNQAIGHEISHIRNKDHQVHEMIQIIGWGALAGVLGQFVFFVENGATIAKFFGYGLASAGVLLGTQYAWQRSVEYRCDEDGVILNGDASGAIENFEDLAKDREAVEKTEFWDSTHPTPENRLRNLKRKFC